MSTDTSFKIFIQLITPILSYGSELWAAEIIKSNTGLDKLFDNTTHLKCNKIELSFIRFILGVHRKADPYAVRGEVARYPLGINFIGNIFKYEQHIMSEKSTRILKQSLKSNIQFSENVAQKHLKTKNVTD